MTQHFQGTSGACFGSWQQAPDKIKAALSGCGVLAKTIALREQCRAHLCLLVLCLSILPGPLLAQPRTSSDRLILKNGKELAGKLIGSSTSSILFQGKNGNPRSYPQAKVSGVVVGERAVSFWKGIVPGLPQYERGQVWKAALFPSLSFVSLFVLGFSILEWSRLETSLRSKERPSQTDVNQIREEQASAVELGAISGSILGITYVWHILDWVWLGNNYDALLGQRQSKNQQHQNFHIFLSYQRGLVSGIGEPTYRATVNFLF